MKEVSNRRPKLIRNLKRKHFDILDKLTDLKIDNEVEDEGTLFGELKKFDFQVVKDLCKIIEAHIEQNPTKKGGSGAGAEPQTPPLT